MELDLAEQGGVQEEAGEQTPMENCEERVVRFETITAFKQTDGSLDTDSHLSMFVCLFVF